MRGRLKPWPSCFESVDSHLYLSRDEGFKLLLRSMSDAFPPVVGCRKGLRESLVRAPQDSFDELLESWHRISTDMVRSQRGLAVVCSRHISSHAGRCEHRPLRRRRLQEYEMNVTDTEEAGPLEEHLLECAQFQDVDVATSSASMLAAALG